MESNENIAWEKVQSNEQHMEGSQGKVADTNELPQAQCGDNATSFYSFSVAKGMCFTSQGEKYVR